jgi:hypothetical protein
MGALNVILIPATKGLMHAPIVFRLGFNYLFTALVSLVMGPLLGGLYFVYLKTIRGQTAGAGDVFAGFQKAYLQLFLGSLVVGLIVGACLMPFNFIWQAKAGPVAGTIAAGADPAYDAGGHPEHCPRSAARVCRHAAGAAHLPDPDDLSHRMLAIHPAAGH